MITKTITLDKQSRLVLYLDFYSQIKSKTLYNQLLQQTPWQQGKISLFGKKINEPRLSAFFSDAGVRYKYSGKLNTGLIWTKRLLKVKKDIQTVAKQDFNSVLLNLYRDHNDSMGWHRDNEKELGANPVIASLSLGQERLFCIRRYSDKSKIHKIKLPSGSLLLMLGNTQQDWEHCIQKEKNSLAGRLNLTFRMIKEPL
jgi:alkylated DNA repair dioxygenase AlkB